MARVLARIRLSRVTDESTSVVRQRREIQKWAKANGHDVVAEAVDEDFSRSLIPFDAPELGPWLTDPVKRGQWDLMVAWKVDRLGAGWMLGKLLVWLMENGKDLACTDTPIKLRDDFGWTTFNLYADAAMTEWKAIRDRVVSSQEKLRTDGRWRGGHPPYWLRAVRKGAGWTLRLDPVSAAVTKEIIRWYLDGRPVEAICHDLNKRGVLAPLDYRRERARLEAVDRKIEYRGKPVSGARWRQATVSTMLTNEGLMGYQVYGGTAVRDAEGVPVVAGEALLTPSEFDALTAETARRKTLREPRRERGAGALLGVARCRQCRGPVYIKNQISKKPSGVFTYRYYKFLCKHSRQLPATETEEIVYGLFLGEVGGFRRLKTEYVAGEDHTAELKQAEAAYDDLTARLDKAPTDNVRRNLSARLDALEANIRELAARPVVEGHLEFTQSEETYADAWERMDSEERRKMMVDAGVVALLKLTPEREVLATIVFPPGFRARLGLDADPDDPWEKFTGNMPPSWEAQAVWEEEHADEIHAATWEQPPGPTS